MNLTKRNLEEVEEEVVVVVGLEDLVPEVPVEEGAGEEEEGLPEEDWPMTDKRSLCPHLFR